MPKWVIPLLIPKVVQIMVFSHLCNGKHQINCKKYNNHDRFYRYNKEFTKNLTQEFITDVDIMGTGSYLSLSAGNNCGIAQSSFARTITNAYAAKLHFA
jgi:hypothetical protein